MQCSNDLQNGYIDLYKQLREYIWDFSTVELLSELEISIFTAFPERDKIKSTLQSLKYQIKDQFEDNEDLKKAYESLDKLVESDDAFYGRLGKVNEVIK